ncbi:hypothetical protein PoB_003387500 [Plakobranchus ocellatus]|uniref:Uncharacterized protein n=1 Tax=Plakobranchus ocellatus TaxID=259542 RepID=A0AAV4AJ59_9GAST|nr:hypothetical protein PoB_003387500 [Plakobranchus ocellatus]
MHQQQQQQQQQLTNIPTPVQNLLLPWTGDTHTHTLPYPALLTSPCSPTRESPANQQDVSPHPSLAWTRTGGGGRGRTGDAVIETGRARG